MASECSGLNNNRIIDNGAFGGVGGGAMGGKYGLGDGDLVQNNLIQDNTGGMIGAWAGGGITGMYCGDNEISHNRIINNTVGIMAWSAGAAGVCGEPPGHVNGTIATFQTLILNNTIKALLAIVSGIIAGLPSLAFVGFNGFTIGILVSAVQPDIGFIPIVAGLAPHGIIEIPLLLLSTSLGLLIGVEAIKCVMGRTSQVKTTMKRSLLLYAKWILPGLVLAALIEVFITPFAINHFIGQ